MTTVVPSLDTERLILRGWAESDFAPLSAFYADDPDSVFVGGPRTGRPVAMWFMARFGQWAMRGYGTYVIAERGGAEFCGWCGVNHYIDMIEPEIQYALLSGHRGKGYMTEACRAAMPVLHQLSGRDVLATTIHPRNPTSQATARRLGAKPTGATKVDDGEVVDIWHFMRGAA